jgi:hypothetical protein
VQTLDGVLRAMKNPQSITPFTPLRQMKSLWQTYGEPSQLLSDMQKRPEHYSAEQREYIEILNRLRAGEVPAQKLDELVLQMVRPTSAAATTREALTTATRPAMHDSSFEDQDFGFALGPGDIVIA